MNCQLCAREFDEGRRRPKLLPKCGHSLCGECLERLRAAGDDFRCPADGIAYARKTEIFDNAFVIESLAAARGPGGYCPQHGKDVELFCADCAVEICASCALFGEHKGHAFEELRAYRGRVSERIRAFRRRAEELEAALGARAQEALEAVTRVKTERREQIDARFEELRVAVERARDAVCEQVSAGCEELLDGFEQQRLRLRDFSARLQETPTLREESLARELRELEKACERNDLCRGREAALARTELVCARSALDAVAGFLALRRPAEPATPKTLSRQLLDPINEEDNLLQESFKELARGSGDSLLSSGEKPPREQTRTPTHAGRPPKLHSPLSAFPGNATARSARGRKDAAESREDALNSTTLFDGRKLSLSPLNTSMMARSTSAVSPVRVALDKSALLDCATSLKAMPRRTVSDRVPAQLELVLAGRSNVLDLSAAGLDDRGAEALARRLPELKGCKTIKLSNNQLTDHGLKCLLKSIKDLSVEYLFLSGNQLRDSALDYLISFRKYNAAMKCVYLNGNLLAKGSARTRLKLKLLEDGNMGLVL